MGGNVRSGSLLTNDGDPMDLNDDRGIHSRYGTWQELSESEYIVGVSGHHSNMKPRAFLAGSIVFLTNLGRQLEFIGLKPERFGGRFDFNAPMGYEVVGLHFCRGKCTGIQTRVCRENFATYDAGTHSASETYEA